MLTGQIFIVLFLIALAIGYFLIRKHYEQELTTTITELQSKLIGHHVVMRDVYVSREVCYGDMKKYNYQYELCDLFLTENYLVILGYLSDFGIVKPVITQMSHDDSVKIIESSDYSIHKIRLHPSSFELTTRNNNASSIRVKGQSFDFAPITMEIMISSLSEEQSNHLARIKGWL